MYLGQISERSELNAYFVFSPPSYHTCNLQLLGHLWQEETELQQLRCRGKWTFKTGALFADVQHSSNFAAAIAEQLHTDIEWMSLVATSLSQYQRVCRLNGFLQFIAAGRGALNSEIGSCSQCIGRACVLGCDCQNNRIAIDFSGSDTLDCLDGFFGAWNIQQNRIKLTQRDRLFESEGSRARAGDVHFLENSSCFTAQDQIVGYN